MTNQPHSQPTPTQDIEDDLRSDIEQTLIVYQTLRKMHDNSPTAWPSLLDDLTAAIQAYANQKVDEAVRKAQIDELRQWADFFSDPSMNAISPSERLRERLAELNNQLSKDK